jgi:hypothetical protein
VLTQVYWAAGSERFLVWSFDQDPALVSPVPPFGTEVDFVFDRRLDGTKIEDLVTVNGMMTSRPKDTPAVHVSWPDSGTVMSNPPVHLVVLYNPGPTFGGVSSFVYARPDVPGFPARDTLKFELVPALFTSPFDEPAMLPPSIPIKTGAFTVTVSASTAPVVPSYQLPLNFSNRLPAVPGTSPHIHVRAAGGDVPYKLLADSSLASRWYLAAADCLGGWPAGTKLEVTIDAELTDAFGGMLEQPTSATFSTAASTFPVDASCAVPEAGAGDTGVDAGVDALVDAGADAPADGGADTPADAGADRD